MADKKQDKLLDNMEVRNWLNKFLIMSVPPSTIDAWIERGRIKADEKKRVWESHLSDVLPKLNRRLREQFGVQKGANGGGSRKPHRSRTTNVR